MKALFLASLLTLSALGALPGFQIPVGEKPNVILLVPSHEVGSPRGAIFEKAYRNSTEIAQAGFSILTGRHPATIGPHQLLKTPPERSEKTWVLNAYTLADLFSHGGYQTAHFGSWNFGLSKSGRLPLDFGLLHYSSVPAKAFDFIRAQKTRPFYVQIFMQTETDAEALEYEKIEQGLQSLVADLGMTDRTIFARTALSPKATTVSLEEKNLRVSISFFGPRAIPTTHERETLISHIDLLPTLGSLARIPVPSPLLYDGEDVAFFTDGKTMERVDPLYWEQTRKNGKRATAIRDGKWKLILEENGTSGLYDLSTDPSEKKNLASHETKVREELENKLQHWLYQLVSPLLHKKLS